MKRILRVRWVSSSTVARVLAATRVQALLTAVVVVLVAAPVAGAATTTRSDVPRIADDVTANGIHVGGLTEAEATAKIDARLGTKMRSPIVVRIGTSVYKLRGSTGGFVLDAARMARGAIKLPPLTDGTTGGTAATKGRDIGPAIRHSRAAVAAFVGKLAGAVYRAPRNATVTLGITKMCLTRQRGGCTIDRAKAAWLINRALDDLDRTRVLRVRTTWIAPGRTANGLRRAYPRVITIDRGTFKLRLFSHLKLSKTYGVAVGMAGLSTPAGRYSIQDKQVDPAWHVPNSAWAGSLAGSTIPGGAPNNPLKARWMGLAGGVGIHGTAEDWSIGSAASHGCIRMHVSDVKDLFRRVTVGTPVMIR